MRIRACLDEVPAGDGSCATEAWVEQPSLLPPMTTEQATDISVAALLAFASVMAVKVAFRKSQ